LGRAEIPQSGLDALLLLVEVLQEKGDEAIQREIKLETKCSLFLSLRLLARLVQMSHEAVKAMMCHAMLLLKMLGTARNLIGQQRMDGALFPIMMEAHLVSDRFTLIVERVSCRLIGIV
jgi:hypothetical protein